MLYLKSCPRCEGDIHGDSDSHGMFLKCLQCGFSRDLTPAMVAKLFGGQPAGAGEVVPFTDQQAA